MTKTKKELTKAQEFEMFMLGISYKHDNEITLCIDDVWEHIQSLLQAKEEEVIERVVGTLYEKRKELLDLLSRFESEDVKRDKIKEELIKKLEKIK